MRAGRLLTITLVLAPLVLSHATGTASASSYQHVPNGSFEQGTANWIAINASLDAVSPGPATTPEGSNVGRVTLHGEHATLRTSGALLAPSGTYRMSAHVYTETGVMVYIESPDTGGATSRTIHGAGWTLVSTELSSSAAFRPDVLIRISAAAGTVVYIDDVRLEGGLPVTATPTPTETSPATSLSPTSTPTPVASPTPAFIDVITDTIRNGSFEDIDAAGLPLSWQKYGGTLSTTSAVARSGVRSATLESNSDSVKWMHQMIAITPGETYEFAAWIQHNHPGVAAAYLRLSWYESSDGSGSAIRTNDSTSRLDAPAPGFRWLTTGPVTAPPTALSVRARMMLAPRSAATAVIHVDDATFALAIPPPSIAAEGAAAAAAPRQPRQASTSGARSTSSRTTASRAPAAVGAASNARVVINEVLYDSVAEGPDAENERVELYNAEAYPVSLAGWALADARSTDRLPDATISPRSFIVIAASDRFFAAHPEFDGDAVVLGTRIGNGLGNDGDSLSLIDPAGRVIDAISWGNVTSVLDPSIPDVPAGHSIERTWPGRDSDHADDWTGNESPSPGRAMSTIDAYTQRQLNGSSIDIITRTAPRRFAWLPWALAAASATALAATAGWRTVTLIRDHAKQA